jgi:hypothetical protein
MSQNPGSPPVPRMFLGPGSPPVPHYSVNLSPLPYVSSPIIPRQDEYPDKQLDNNLSRDQQIMVDMMKTIYADHTVLRDVVLKYKDQFDLLIRLSREAGPKHRPLDFATVLTEPYLLDSPEKVNSNYVSALLDMLGFVIKYDELEEKITTDIYVRGYRPPSFSFSSRRIPIDNLMEYRKGRHSWYLEYDAEPVDPLYQEMLDIVVKIWNGIVEDMKDLGYEFHYFAFFRSSDPRVRTFWHDIKLTPQNFEAATMLFDPKFSETIENNIRDESNIVYNKSRRYWPRVGHFGNQVVGWRKHDLWNAIKATGLNKPEIELDPLAERWNKLNSELFIAEQVNNDYDTALEIWKELETIPRNINRHGRHFTKLADMFGRSKYSTKGTMAGIDTKYPYMNKSYYEAIYRRIFNTMIHVDWVQVCQQKLVELPDLKQIAITKFGFAEDDINRLEYEPICGLLEQESVRRRGIREELMLGVPQAQEVIAYQPGGRIARQAEAEMIAQYPGTFAAAEQPQLQQLDARFMRLYNICLSPESTKEDVMRIAQEMDLEVFLARLPTAEQTKEGYCRVLQNYVERVETRSPL